MMVELIVAGAVGAIMGLAFFGLCIAYGMARDWWDGKR